MVFGVKSQKLGISSRSIGFSQIAGAFSNASKVPSQIAGTLSNASKVLNDAMGERFHFTPQIIPNLPFRRKWGADKCRARSLAVPMHYPMVLTLFYAHG